MTGAPIPLWGRGGGAGDRPHPETTDTTTKRIPHRPDRRRAMSSRVVYFVERRDCDCAQRDDPAGRVMFLILRFGPYRS